MELGVPRKVKIILFILCASLLQPLTAAFWGAKAATGKAQMSSNVGHLIHGMGCRPLCEDFRKTCSAGAQP